MTFGGAAVRLGPLRHGGLPRLAAPGRPDDRRRPGQPEDGAGAAPDLRPDGRAALGARDGRLRQSRGGMFNNYAIVQGVDHVVPVDMYLPGCPPRPEMLIDAVLKLHHKIMNEPLGPKRAQAAGRPEGRARPVEHQVRPLMSVTVPSVRSRTTARPSRAPPRSRSRRSAPGTSDTPVRRRAARHVRRGRLRRHLRLRRPACASRGSPPAAERPYGGYFDEVVDALRRGLPATPTRRSRRSSSTAAS